MEWLERIISTLPDWMQFISVLLIILVPVVSGVIGVMKSRETTRAIEAKAEADRQRDEALRLKEEERSKREDEKREHQARLEAERNAHARETERIRNEAAQNKQQTEISQALMSLIKDQITQTALVSQQSQEHQARNINALESMLVAIQMLNERTIAAFTGSERELRKLSDNVNAIPVSIEEQFKRIWEHTIRGEVHDIVKQRDDTQAQRHAELNKKMNEIVERVTSIDKKYGTGPLTTPSS